MSTESKIRNITIIFDSDEAARHFAMWLCDSGEQLYWDWMEYREQEEEGDITAIRFGYHGEGSEKEIPAGDEEEEDEDDCGEFMCDWTIRTELGRLNRG